MSIELSINCSDPMADADWNCRAEQHLKQRCQAEVPARVIRDIEIWGQNAASDSCLRLGGLNKEFESLLRQASSREYAQHILIATIEWALERFTTVSVQIKVDWGMKHQDYRELVVSSREDFLKQLRFGSSSTIRIDRPFSPPCSQ